MRNQLHGWPVCSSICSQSPSADACSAAAGMLTAGVNTIVAMSVSVRNKCLIVDPCYTFAVSASLHFPIIPGCSEAEGSRSRKNGIGVDRKLSASVGEFDHLQDELNEVCDRLVANDRPSEMAFGVAEDWAHAMNSEIVWAPNCVPITTFIRSDRCARRCPDLLHHAVGPSHSLEPNCQGSFDGAVTSRYPQPAILSWGR